MKLLKNVFDFYISSNMHIAFAICSLTKITLLKYGIHENFIPLFVFFATIIAYNFIRFYQINTLHIHLKQRIKTFSINLILLNTISLFILVYLVFKIRIEALVLLFPFILASVFYAVPISSNNKSLRSVASLKLFLIAFTCSGVTVLFPLIQYGIHFSTAIWILFVQRFLLIVAITIPFDIRDVNFDNPELRTLPQTIGVKNAKIVGSFSLLLFFVLGFLIAPITKMNILTLFAISTISFVFLTFSTTAQPKYYSSFWVESIPVIWFILEIVLK